MAMLKVSVDWKNKILDILNKKRQKIKVQRKKKKSRGLLNDIFNVSKFSSEDPTSRFAKYLTKIL